MALELFLPPFLQAQSFLNLHSAFGDVDFGVNNKMLCLGANYGLHPNDLLKIVHDRTTKLNRDKIIELLENGVTSIDYICNFNRLCNLGFTMVELRILMEVSISAENILVYDAIQLFKAIGFTSDFGIESFIKDNIQPAQVFSFIEIGFSVDQYRQIRKYIKQNITPFQAFSFDAIGLEYSCEMLQFIKAEISAEKVSLFLQISPQPSLSVIMNYIQNKISPDEIVAFHAVGVEDHIAILKFIKANVLPEQLLPFHQIGIEVEAHSYFIVHCIQKNISADDQRLWRKNLKPKYLFS